MYKILLCQRYLRSRYIALASVISVMLGVATMIVVNSVMAGFGTEMRQRIHGILADVIVETTSLDGVSDYSLYQQTIMDAAGGEIEAMTATVEIYAILSFEFGSETVTRPVTLIGIVPAEKAAVSPLTESLESYKPQTLADGTVVPAAHKPGLRDDWWELTELAADYRREWAERQQNFADPGFFDADADHEPADEEDAPPESTVEPTTEDAADEGDSSPNNEGETLNPFATTGGGSDIVSAFENETTEDVDAAAPLRGRIYVGATLIEFPYPDPKTGKTRMMRMVHPGDDVRLSTVKAGRPEPAHFHATIVDVFKSGMSEYDSSLVFCNLEYLQEMRGMIHPQTGEGAITSIQIKLKDYERAGAVVELLQSKLPPRLFTVKTWESKQDALLAAVEVERAILNVLLFLIIAVAGFGILAIFFMIVVEKTRDIGILKALGASANGIMTIFLSYGLSLGIVGSGVGVLLGLLFVHYINVIEDFLTWVTGRPVFDETIYYFPEIPTMVSPAMVFWVASGAVMIAVLASILPARRAARLRPVEALRYE